MRRFTLERDLDHTGVSGVGRVAEGCQFGDGTAVIRWLGQRSSVVVWSSVDDAEAVHGHDGATRFEWMDQETP